MQNKKRGGNGSDSGSERIPPVLKATSQKKSHSLTQGSLRGEGGVTRGGVMSNQRKEAGQTNSRDEVNCRVSHNKRGGEPGKSGVEAIKWKLLGPLKRHCQVGLHRNGKGRTR